MSEIVNFFNHPFFIVAGGITTFVTIITFILGVVLVFQGFIPVLWKLGNSVVYKKIDIFANSDDYNSIKKMLLSSKIFKEKNINHISIDDFRETQNSSLVVLSWKTAGDKISEIMKHKKESATLIIYAPHDAGRLDDATMDLVNSSKNTILSNFRGRFVNDVFISLITN